ncbi:MAG: 6-phospho-beta-glucosidase [Candidatus Coatesbacteria bacterium]
MNKIAVIGAGSVYTPELVTEFFKDGGKLVPFDEMALMDIDRGRLAAVGGLTQRMARRQGVRGEISLTTSLTEAIRGAKFVIVQIRVGGNRARALDETIPYRYGVIGQETTGPGGMFKALRTIPAVVEIAKTVKRVAPRAWILNFTNPSGLVTEAVLKAVPGVKMLGICSAQLGREWWVARALGVKRERIKVRSAGLNHLAWVYRVSVDGRDVTDRLFNLPDRRLKHLGWPVDLMRSIRMVPIGYLWYYYYSDKMLPHSRPGHNRAKRVMEIERILMKRYADPALDEPPKELSLRGGSGYSLAMSTVMNALTGRKPCTIPMNVQNRGAVEGFARDQVLEIDSTLRPAGVTPVAIPLRDLPPHLLGLTHQVKAYETLTAEAAMTGCYHTALEAMITHPLVPNATVGQRILDEMLKAHRKYLPKFR